MKIRRALESDIPQLISISESAPEAAHWTAQQWTDIFRLSAPARIAWVAENAAENSARDDQQRVIGLLIALRIGPEWELENIAVLPDSRRQGVGAALVSTLLHHVRSEQGERVLLELRASNLSAFQFYSLAGFQLLARRPDYYANPAEDALIMVHHIQN